MSRGRLHVAVGAIVRADEVLISLRDKRLHQGGKWEFPGGKLEPGESVTAALARELQEELGLTPVTSRPLIRIPHSYPDREVLLDVWKVTDFRGEPHHREGQPLRWVRMATLDEYEFPEANRPIVAALRLPERWAITPPGAPPLTWIVDRAARHLRVGDYVLLRAPQLGPADYTRWVGPIVPALRELGISSVLTSDAAEVEALGAAGLHLSSRRLAALDHRPIRQGLWLSSACHDAAELARAAVLPVDLALISPVRETTSHPGARVLDWSGFAALAERAAMPVYALGGVGPGDVETAWQHGGQGVAGISGFWGDAVAGFG